MKIENLSPDEIYHVDNFLDFVYSHKMHFKNDKFDQYKNENGGYDIYNLTNHRAFVITMISEVKASGGEIFSVTKKALEIYDLGGYSNWRAYNEARIDFFKGQPKRDVDMHESIVLVNDQTRSIYKFQKRSTWATSVILIIGLVIAFFQYQVSNSISKTESMRLKDSKSIDQKNESFQVELNYLKAQVDSLRMLKSDSTK